MAVMKRIQGWRDSGWPIPNTLQMLCGLIPYRDPDAYREAKRDARMAAREAREERLAIQADGCNPTLPMPPPKPRGPLPEREPATKQGSLF